MTAVFFAACDDGGLGAPKYTVTFDSNGGTDVPKQTVEDGQKVPEPTVPTKVAKDEGLYKGSLSSTFVEWQKDGTKYDFNSPVTASFTLTAKWSNEPVAATLTGTDDILTKAVNYLKLDTTAIADGDKYTLILGDDITVSKQIVIDKKYLNLTIGIETGGTKTIQSALVNGSTTNATKVTPSATNPTSNHAGVLILIGKSGQSATADKINVTLVNVELKGPATGEVNDSLVRVQYGATLTIDKAFVRGHKNNGGYASGLEGNGSAVCAANEGILIIKGGSVIEENQATATKLYLTSTGADNTANGRFLVAGVYAIDKAIIKIEGGAVEKNTYTLHDGKGHTKGVYATEDVEFDLTGDVTIDELTINAEKTSSTATPTTTTIKVSNLSKSITLNLRASGNGITGLGDAKDAWAPATGTAPKIIVPLDATSELKQTDLDIFTLNEFRMNSTDVAAIVPETPSVSDPGYELKLAADKKSATLGKKTFTTP